MCGFVGVFKSSSHSQSPVKPTLHKMLQSLQHRGPDAQGIFENDQCALGHQRLSILDLTAAGNQPMSSENKKVWIAYNGETYNFQALRQQFRLEDQYRFRSRTDTEVILHLYQALGIDCLKHLDGMFALSIYDQTTGELHLARDPFGIKPLFYTQTPDGFWFASEMKALLQISGFEKKPSLEALHHFLAFDYVPGPLTAFENIHELRPGHWLTLKQGEAQPQMQRFYDFDYPIAKKLSEKEAIQYSREALMLAVEKQLISDVPVGVMLSGGMDSSALSACMAKIRGDSDFHTFSLAFEDPSFDESSYAKMVADNLGTKHHEISVTSEKVKDLLPKYMAFIDEPYADGSAIPTYLLAEEAKNHVTVLLSGEGGDEFFSGYDTHLAYKYRKAYRRIPRWARAALASMVEALPPSDKKLSFEFKAKRFVRGAELGVPESHFYWRHVLSEDAKREIVKDPKLFDGFSDSVMWFVDTYRNCSAEDELNRLLYIDAHFHLPDDLMIKNDRMTMAHSLEARVPFTDKDLVRFLSEVPVKFKLKGRRKKHLLRSAMHDLLPEKVLDKKKVGLEMPYSRWMRQELREMTEHYFSEDHLNQTGLFNAQGVRRLWQEHLSRKQDHARALWGLLNYFMWHDIFIKTNRYESYLHAPRASRMTVSS